MGVREARRRSKGAMGVWGCIVEAVWMGKPRMSNRMFSIGTE